MDRLKALSVFQAVARQGSFSRAAECLDISPAVATRTVQDLEALLGARLLQRTTRRVGLTSAGEEILAQANELLERYEQITLARDASRQPFGKVRLGAAAWLGPYLTGSLTTFLARHPKVSIELRLWCDGAEDVGPPPDVSLCIQRELRPEMIARRIAVASVGCYAAPRYLEARGEPTTPQELAEHNLVDCANGRDCSGWQFTCLATKCSFNASVKASISTCQFDTLGSASAHGAGIALLPDFLAEPLLASGRVRRILPGWRADAMSFHVAYASRRHQPPVVSRLIDHLEQTLPIVLGDSPAQCASSLRSDQPLATA